MLRLLAVAVLAASTPAHATWWRAESDNFRVYGDRSEAQVRAAAEKLEGFRDLLMKIHGIKPVPDARKLDVYLVNSNSDLRKTGMRGVAGYYYAGLHSVAAVVLRSGDKKLSDEVLQHEYAHHFMRQHFPYPYPLWFTEGFAEYFMTAEVHADRIEIGDINKVRQSWLSYDVWMTSRELFTKNEWLFDDVGRGYALSWLVTHYMYRQSGNAKPLEAYLRAVAAGQAADLAFRNSFGMSFREFDAKLRAYGRAMTKSVLSRQSAAPASVAVAELAPSADKLLLLSLQLRQGVERKDASRVLADVRRGATPYLDDVFVQLTLAHAELTAGNDATAQAIVDKLLLRDPNNVDALVLRGLTELAAKPPRPEEAKRYFARAYNSDQTNHGALFLYGMSMLKLEKIPSENTLNVISLAVNLAPQVEEMQLAMALALMQAQHYPEAIRSAELLANAPHGSHQEPARKLIAEAKAAMGVASNPVQAGK